MNKRFLERYFLFKKKKVKAYYVLELSTELNERKHNATILMQTGH